MWFQSLWRRPTPPRRRATACACLRAALAAGMLGRAGCATLPDTQFLKRRYTSQAVRFNNAWGPLSDRKSAAILAELKRKSGNLDILDRQVVLDQAVAGQPLVVGN